MVDIRAVRDARHNRGQNLVEFVPLFGRRPRSRGQSLVEFALVFPVFIALVGGIVQFGMLFWAQNTLTQIVRDTGRWEATQQKTPCSSNTTDLATQANIIASNSSLFGYTAGEFGVPTAGTDASVRAFNAPNAMAVAWVMDADPENKGCPPENNKGVWHVTIKINHTVPTFFPGLDYLPGLGTCDASGCHIMLSSTAQFRMEPKP